MDSVFRDGDAEEVAANSKEGYTWYILHHRVYHPRKPERNEWYFTAQPNLMAHLETIAYSLDQN